MSNTSHSQNQQNKDGRPFRCAKCNRIFPHQGGYQEHLRGHNTTQKTNVPNPTDDISTADETARYIAERRKNFPTTDNINKKMKSDEERQEHGDVLETRQFGRIKERKTTQMKNIETESTKPVVATTVVNNVHSNAIRGQVPLGSSISLFGK